MDGSTIQNRVYRGYAIAASKIGLPFSQFRPSGVANPTSGSPLATLNASFAPDKNYSKYGKSGDHDAMLWTVLVDGSQTQVGDYLVGASGTYFIAAMQPILPILAVKCTHTISVSRVASQSSPGVNPYGGDKRSGESAILTGFPAWLERAKSASTRGGTEGHLPGDIGERSFEVLLPPVPVQVYLSDIITDEQSQRYIVLMVEKSDLGLRIAATQAAS